MAIVLSRFRSTLNTGFVRVASHVLAAACVLWFGASIAHAQSASTSEESKGPLTIVLTQSKVVTENQREVLADASKVKPGDVIEYRARYTNTGKQPVTRLVATLPLAAGLELLPHSARPAQPAPTATATDGIYAAMPLSLGPVVDE